MAEALERKEAVLEIIIARRNKRGFGRRRITMFRQKERENTETLESLPFLTMILYYPMLLFQIIYYI